MLKTNHVEEIQQNKTLAEREKEWNSQRAVYQQVTKVTTSGAKEDTIQRSKKQLEIPF